MPIDVTSEPWSDAPEASSTKVDLLEFLRNRPDRAYSVFELSDELLGTDWESVYEKEREIGRVGEEEYYAGRGEDGLDFGRTIERRHSETFLRVQLSDLVYAGELRARVIPNEELDLPYEEGVTAFYTYAGD